MQLAIEILIYGGLVPAAISLATVLLGRVVLPEGAAGRYPAALGLGLGFFVGYAVLPWTPLVPARHWQWLPYAGAVAMAMGPIGRAGGVSVVERLLLNALAAVVAAFLLVPTWPDLEPSRPVYVALLAAYLVALAALLEPLPVRLPGRLFLPLLAGAAACAAVMLAVFVSITFGQVAGVAAAALAGCSVAMRFGTAATLARSAMLWFAVIVGGCAFVGFIEPKPPLFGLLLAPAAPLALWSCAVGPLSRLRGWRAAAAQIGAVLVPLTAAALVAWLGESAASQGY